MTSAPLKKAPINWTASITLIGTPILAAILIPLYAYYYDFSVSAWVSMIFLLALSSLALRPVIIVFGHIVPMKRHYR